MYIAVTYKAVYLHSKSHCPSLKAHHLKTKESSLFKSSISEVSSITNISKASLCKNSGWCAWVALLGKNVLSWCLLHHNDIFISMYIAKLLAAITDLLFWVISQGLITDFITVDLSKAFDKVDLKLLLHNIDHFGVDSNQLAWMQFLKSDHRQWL